MQRKEPRLTPSDSLHEARRPGPLGVQTKPGKVWPYLAFWLSLMAWMHFPSVSSELLMFPASFSLSPVLWVREHLSDPARSHRASLNTQTESSRAPPPPHALRTVRMMNPTYSLMPRTLGTPTSSTRRILMEKMLWLQNTESSLLNLTAKNKHHKNVDIYLLLTCDWTAGSVWWRRNSGSSSQSSSLCRPPLNCSPGPSADLRDTQRSWATAREQNQLPKAFPKLENTLFSLTGWQKRKALLNEVVEPSLWYHNEKKFKCCAFS